MANHIEINDHSYNWVHFDKEVNNYTLCGLETGGDERFSIEKGIPTKKLVNCPDCINIVQFCKAIKTTEFEPPKETNNG